MFLMRTADNFAAPLITRHSVELSHEISSMSLAKRWPVLAVPADPDLGGSFALIISATDLKDESTRK